ncbi:MAG: cadherin-like beta sandwich domain-containing protein [Fibrobacteres bacterium]|nr:cadherin-like beta sandwich domain-containing protein [Fibrobacterota bacterium]
MNVSRFLLGMLLFGAVLLAAMVSFQGCNTTSPEDKFKIEADSAWLAFDRLVIFRDSKSQKPDTLFNGKLASINGLNALSAGDYDGGKVQFTIQGYVGGQLVLSQTRDYDGATKITQVNTLVDFSAPPTSVTLSQDTLRTSVGAQSGILIASVLPAKTRQSVTWKSLGGVGYLVFQNGDSGTSVKVYGNTIGIGKVIAQARNDTGKADTAIVIVSDSTIVGSVEMDPDSIQLHENGETYSFQVRAVPEGAKLFFDSRDSLVASVDSAGKVTAHREGTTRIVVRTEAGFFDSSIVDVIPVRVLPSVTLRPDSIQLKENGQVFALQALVVPAGDSLDFLSRDTSVATVDAFGRVRSRKLGKTRVVATAASGKSDSTVVEVIQEVVPPGSVRISPDSIRLKEGGKQDTLKINRSADLPSARVTFQSRDTAVVKVDSLGRFRTGKPGKAWIVATIEGGDPDSSLIDVFANAGPVIESFGPNATVSIRDTAAFALSAQDPDGVIRTVVWRLGKDTSVQVRDTVEKSVVQRSRTAVFADTGTYLVRVSVFDENGASASDSATVRVVLDPPVVNAGRDTVAKAGASLVFTGSATQAFGRVVMWKWDYDGNGIWDDSSATSPTFSHAIFKEGRYAATLYARDDDGNVGTDYLLIDITNSPLVSFGLSPRDTVISIKDSVPFLAQAASSDGQVRSISWDYDGDGAQDEALSVNESSLTFRGGYRYNVAGTYKLSLKVTDNSGRTVIDSARITVKQDLPKALAGADTLVFTGTSITLHARGIDTLGMIVKKEWSISGGKFATASQPDTTFTAPSTASALNCILRVTDDDGFSSTDTVIVTVALHRETRLTGLSVSAGKTLPAFNPDSLVYRDTVGLSVASVKLTATLRDVSSGMKLNGKALVSGIASDSLKLNMGLNTYTISIIAEDTAYKKTYTVQVVKIDDVPPLAPTVSVQDTTAAAVLGRPIWTWVSGGGGGAGYRYKLDDTLMAAGATATAAAAYQPDTLKFLTVGYHTLYVQEKDSANNWSPSGSARIWVGPISWYKLDNNGSDSGLNAAALVFTGGSAFAADRKSVKLSALEFDGTGGSATVAFPKIAAGSKFTFSFWFKNAAKDTATRIIAATPDNSIFFSAKPNAIAFGVSLSASFSASGIFIAGLWTHAAGVYDGKTVQLYVNGVLVGTLAAAGSISGDLTGLRFGGTDGAPWSGTLDDVRIYRRVMTAGEIAKIYAQ